MRAWTILVFIIALQAALVMLNTANPLSTGMNINIDTSSPNRILISQNYTSPQMPQPDSHFYGTDASGKYCTSVSGVNNKIFTVGSIWDITKLGDGFSMFLNLCFNMFFAIYTTAAPFIGAFNASVLQGLVDVVLVVALIQIFTGRSFKTGE